MSSVVERQRRLASAFRERMTAGQSYDASNLYRESFYDEVIKLADEVNFLSFPVFCENDGFLELVKSSELVSNEENEYTIQGSYTSGVEGLKDAGEKLCRFVDEHSVLDSQHGPRRPLVILAFDEAHVLRNNPPGQPSWNLFLELRRILQQFHDHAIFSVFLSTAGRFKQFSPDTREPDNRPLDPITEISFDDVAYPALKDTVSLSRVISTDWISHLGRPLYVHPNHPFGERLTNHLE